MTSLLNTVTSVLGLSSGAAFRDRGTLIDRRTIGRGCACFAFSILGACSGRRKTANGAF